MPKVFISHRIIDKKEAEALALALENAGHSVWIDVWAINIGDSIVKEINEGLTKSNYFVLCYSDSGIDSPWMSREWMSTLGRQLNSHDVKILPAVLTGGEPPAILADIKYVNLAADWVGGLALLLKSIK